MLCSISDVDSLCLKVNQTIRQRVSDGIRLWTGWETGVVLNEEVLELGDPRSALNGSSDQLR